jgi:uncharacterized protein YbjT (DUF2867 family)
MRTHFISESETYLRPSRHSIQQKCLSFSLSAALELKAFPLLKACSVPIREVSADRLSALARDAKYSVRVLTRHASSPEAAKLAELPGVTIFEGDAYTEADLIKAFDGVQYVFANTNGFAIGEKAEIYWGIRLYELARRFGIKHFVYAGLYYASKLGGYDPALRCGHLDGKGKVVQYLKSQPTTPMAWSVVTSCLYIEMLSSDLLRPRADSEGNMVFSLPVGDAKVPLIHLEDYGKYIRWAFDNSNRSNGIELIVATEDIRWKDVAKAFSEITGRNAVYKEISTEELFKINALQPADLKLGQSANPHETTLQTVRENFTGFFNFWKAGLIATDYQLLDEILPTRVKSVKDWMIKAGYTGEPGFALKDKRGSAGKA